MPKKGKTEEKTGGESGVGRWMLTYLDMVTLLFGVFVIMYAMSNVSKEKAAKVAESLREGFRGGFTMFVGPGSGGQTILQELNPPGTMNKRLYRQIMQALKKEIKREDFVSVTQTDRGIRIGFVGDTFFQSGSARLTDEMKDALSDLAPLLKGITQHITIEGFTDDVPTRLTQAEPGESRDNWELAARRAINVLRYFEEGGVAPSRMSIQSYGKYKPVDMAIQETRHNNTPEYRALNRRVDILIEEKK